MFDNTKTMQNNINYWNSEGAIISEPKTKEIMDYSELLKQFGLEYKKVKHYYQVGEIEWSQGWILHVSVVISQLPALIQVIVPFLMKENISFRVAGSREIARSILHGQYGYILLGKVICIYPTEQQVSISADVLIKLTQAFKGPRILTDRHLGSVIYTRYGACNPIIQVDESGREDEYIYNSNGILAKDIHTVPFTMPENIQWPYENIANPIPAAQSTILRNRYKHINILKPDAKGNVTKALWLKKVYKLKWCVIKEGKYCMDSDDHGRDMFDRLRWQMEMHNDLCSLLPIPKVYDFFQEDRETYLVIEFIRGVTLDNVITEVFAGRIWWQLSLADRLMLLKYVDMLLDIIDLMHQKGYIHRDINPGNFLVSKNKGLRMIDLELSFSTKNNKPFPPFLLGTSGFMSPEQESSKLPSFEQDIYSIGCSLILSLTDLLPGKFAIGNRQTLYEQLYFFLKDCRLVKLLCDCLECDPSLRPTIRSLKEGIDDFRQAQARQNHRNTAELKIGEISRDVLKSVIAKSIAALATPAMLSRESLWLSKTIEEEALTYYQSESESVYGGFGEGLSGTLFLLARAHQVGFSITPCLNGYHKSMDFIRNRYLHQAKQIPGGLYAGSAGFAIAMIEGFKCGLVLKHTETVSEIKSYLENENVNGCGIIKGSAGLGLVILQGLEVINNMSLKATLDRLVDEIISQQQKDGSWITITDDKKAMVKVTGVGHGVSGILNFLMDYLRQNIDRKDIEESVINGLRWLIRQGSKRNKAIAWYFNNKSKNYSSGLQDGNCGIALTFIKAYELFEQPLYQNICESVFVNYPVYATNRDITQANGLTGIGEVYLKALKVFKSEEWQQRASWIAQYLLHHYRLHEDGSNFWLVDGSPFSTAGFMTGNSGVIHFLLNYYEGDFYHPLTGV